MPTMPALGYPSRTAAVVALRAQGLSTREIAARIGIPRSNVFALEASAKRAKSARPDPGPLPGSLLDALAPHARRRGLTPEALARKILGAVVRDGLIDAVLDDGVAAPQEAARR